MAKRELEIKTIDSENGKVFVLSQSIKGFGEYEKAKAINKFINSETKVLEMAIETYLRQVLRDNGVIPLDGSQKSLEEAILKFKYMGKEFEIVDRYYELNGERIIGESANNMTIINEDNILSCAIEVIIHGQNI